MRMKFRVRFYEDKWNGRTLSTGKQVKQKTFYADEWDEAEKIEWKMNKELQEQRGCLYQSSLSRLA